MTVVAIDGPAGSGKSTIARALAERLNVAHVDTGAYYRAATLVVLRAGVPVDDEHAVLRVITAAQIARRGGRTYLDGVDVEEDIRSAAVTSSVSAVSRHVAVRSHLVALQRAEVGASGAVVEGRDAGTVVVPGADVKVWLTASPRERARRRAAQLGERGAAAVHAHAADITRRDASDAAQMARAAGAVEIDTTGRTVTDIVDDVAAHVSAASRAPG